MNLSLTELRQRLFKLADQVAETGVPLTIERRGVRLQLIRLDEMATGGRLQHLMTQPLVQGPPLDPTESPARWSEDLLRVADASAAYQGDTVLNNQLEQTHEKADDVVGG